MAAKTTLDNAAIPIDDFNYIFNDLHGSTSVSIADASDRKNKQVFFESLKSSDHYKGTLARRYTESIKASTRQYKAIRTLSKDVAKSSDNYRYGNKFLGRETIKFQEHSHSSIKKNRKENVLYSDKLIRKFTANRHLVENLSIKESTGKASQANASETIGVYVNAPYLNLPMTIDLSANVTLDEANIPIDRFIYEVYYKQKDCKLWVRANKQESYTASEVYRKNTNLLKNETLLNGIVMRPLTFFDRFIMENVEALEMANKAVYERFAERMLSWDDENAQISKNVLYNVVCGINFSRTWSGKKSFYENVIANSVKSYHVTLPRIENAIGVSASRIAANPNGVLSDIFVRANEVSEADFGKLSEHPSGYNYFSPFRVGEYEYQDALYRIKIKKSGGTSNPLIYDYKVNVDIDDVKDRGTATIPAEETKVYFNRSYYTEPDVVVNVVSGAEGKVIVPFIISTDGEDDKGRYFTIILKDTSGNPVEGTISWNSNGY